MRKPPILATDAERAAYHAGRADALRDVAIDLAEIALEADTVKLHVSVVVNLLQGLARNADDSCAFWQRTVRAGAA